MKILICRVRSKTSIIDGSGTQGGYTSPRIKTPLLIFILNRTLRLLEKIVDAWVDTPCAGIGLSWQATSGHEQFTNQPMGRYPHHTTNWANP
ncbi:MAG: hypothetical protein GKR87_16315 [Kiritimatiellae bacterium]|nr:hypothetical protein [Kiritimatiellia bacterium]